MANARYLQRAGKDQCGLIYSVLLKESVSFPVPMELIGYDSFEDEFENHIFFFWRDAKNVYAIVSLSMIMAQPRSAQFGIVSIVKRGGHGTEALVALFRHCFGLMGLHRLWCVVNDDNEAAVSGIRKIPSLKYEGILRESRFKDGEWGNQLMYSVLDSEVE